MDLARPLIEERMQQYEGNQIQFNLLALCKSPLVSIPTELATNINTLTAIENQLSRAYPEWKQFVGDSETDIVLHGPNVIYRLSQELVDSAPRLRAITEKLEVSTTTAEGLFQMRQELIDAQSALRAAMIEEMTAIEQDNERALARRHDYTPMIHTWLRFLAQNGALEDLAKAAERG
jgi:ubiquitin carboxyl-terminal hydrolase L5